MGVTPKFKAGDFVLFTQDRGLAPTSRWAHAGALARVADPAYSQNGRWLLVQWLSNPKPEQNPISQQNGGYWDKDFELAPPPNFTLKLPTYDDVDTATDLATRIATQFNINVEVVRS